MAFKFFPHFQPFKKSSFLLLAFLLAVPASGAARAEPVQIVGFGDSLMAGYGLGPGESFPEKLEAALQAKGFDVAVANAGVSGDTTSGGLTRLEWSVPEEADVVVVELGANDMLRGIPPASTEANLEAIVEKLQARGHRVVLAGMRAAPNLGPDYAAAFDPIYERLAGKYGLTLIPFFLDGVAAEPTFLQEDGMHPNAKGIERMVERLLPVIARVLEEQKEEDA
ncbi:arylesterase [Nitratireductor sp. ZSWI3]|uniref:arylesterase n=1 Tax=Nitratireductor sp. ZSWI3 TaxID=2966359 RepID=UPI00214F9F5D|nr:arylesterase [Nitratireductor sp. ZSWI3]MCR4266955.1 arylesterase [Nitratireductor sp. ZSWI3]